jgi:hypothetical protein
MSSLVKDMRRIEKSDQHVHIKQHGRSTLTTRPKARLVIEGHRS